MSVAWRCKSAKLGGHSCALVAMMVAACVVTAGRGALAQTNGQGVNEVQALACVRPPGVGPQYYRVVFELNAQVLADPQFQKQLDLRTLPAFDDILSGVELAGDPLPVFRSRSDLRDRWRAAAEGVKLPKHLESAPLLYFEAFTADARNAETLRQKLLDNANAPFRLAEYAAVEGWVQAERYEGAPPAPWPAGNVCSPDLSASAASGDLSSCQTYLRQATNVLRSVDADYAHEFLGGRGEGVRLVLLDEGFDPDHEDLPDVVTFSSDRVASHGNASLGVCCGVDDNDTGIRGIAAEAEVGFAHVWDGPKHNTADAITRVAKWLDAGDVILIELNAVQCEGGAVADLVPMEAFKDVRAAIEIVNRAGIHVVEAAGNGGRDLATVPGMLDDGPAILVGAADADGNVNTALNYGKRVDLHGWGDGVVTAGGDGGAMWCTLRCPYDPHRCYMNSFGGTSSAAAMVAGVVASLSGIVQSSTGKPLTPEKMKEVLKANCLTPPAGQSTCQPNLRRVLDKLASQGYKLLRH